MMISLRMLPLLALFSSFLSTCVAQDGFTWWVNPNSTETITFQEGDTVTLQWVTDFPEFNVVLYQNLGDSYGEFVSEYLLEEASGIDSFDWTVAPIQDNTLTSNLSFHLDITLANNDANGANSQEFLIQPNGNNSSPTSAFPTDPYNTGAYPTDAYPSASATATVYEPYPYPVTITTTERGVVTTITIFEPTTITSFPSDVSDLSGGFATMTTSAVVRAPTAAGGSVTVSTRTYSSTVSAAQQTGSQSTTATKPTFTGEGARNINERGIVAMAALGVVVAAL